MQKPEMCGAVIFVNVNQSGKPAAPGFGKRQDRWTKKGKESKYCLPLWGGYAIMTKQLTGAGDLCQTKAARVKNE